MEESDVSHENADELSDKDSTDVVGYDTYEKHGKRERASNASSSETSQQMLENTETLCSEANKKIKRESLPDSSIPNDSSNKGNRHQRNYRTRLIESSSSSDDDENFASAPEDSLSCDQNDCELPKPSELFLNGSNENGIHNGDEVSINREAHGRDNDYSSTSNQGECHPGANVDIQNSEINDAAQSVDPSTDGVEDPTSSPHAVPMETNDNPPVNNGRNETVRSSSNAAARRLRRFITSSPPSSESDEDFSLEGDDSDDCEPQTAEEKANERAKRFDQINKEVAAVLSKPMPKHNWHFLQAVIDRQYGMSANKQSPQLFTNRMYDSLHIVNRLQMKSKLDFHDGCVNALNFDDSGTLLASSSDDLQIAIWDWAKERTCITYDSGHRSNVFQCKFIRVTGNTFIASCGRDGQVRLADLTPSGVCRDTRRIAKHARSAHKLATRPSAPYEVMSAGEDAVVYNIDIRQESPDKLVVVKDVHGSKIALYSINQHPINDNEFCVCGLDEYVRIFDRRLVSTFGPPVLKYCPLGLVDKTPQPNITCAVYSNNGDAIVASYNDEDIFLFDTSQSEAAEPAHCYSGHRNSSTVKGVNFFSPSSRYVISGSDCGNIFIWDRDTEAIVNCFPGDENGVVNVLEPHPHLPILATSGLDNEVKMWMPFADEDPQLSTLQKTVRSNMLKRLHERSSRFHGPDTHMLMMMFQHLSRSASRNRRARHRTEDDTDDAGILESSESSNTGTDSDSDNGDDLPIVRQYRQECSSQ